MARLYSASPEFVGELQQALATTNEQTLTLRMSKNGVDIHTSPLTKDKLEAMLSSTYVRRNVDGIRHATDEQTAKRLKVNLPCIFWQGTLDVRRYAEDVKELLLQASGELPSAVNQDLYFSLAAPFVLVDFDQPHAEGAERFDARQVYDKVSAVAPSGEMVFAQVTARYGLRLAVRRNDTESIRQIQQRYAEYAGIKVDILTDYTRRSFTTTQADLLFCDTESVCQPFTRENAMKWAFLDQADAGMKTPARRKAAQPDATPKTLSKGSERMDTTDADYLRQVAAAVDALLGGAEGVGEGSRHNRYMQLLGYMRYLCEDTELLTTCCGYEDLDYAERRGCAQYVLANQPREHTPQLLDEAVAVVSVKVAQTAQSDEPAETGEPRLPTKLPSPLKKLVSKVHPLLHPMVIRGCFPAWATHLHGQKVRYANGTDLEMPMLHLIIAPQGSGKSSVVQPSNIILQSIIQQDNLNRQREADWKKAKRRGATVDRPDDLCVQVLAPDMTSAALSQKAADAGGRPLYVRDDELDNLKKMSGGSVEAATVIIRNAFDNTVWGQERVGAESVTVRCPLRLNLCLSTTPNGALQFFKAATTQNGTLQRLALSTINNPDHVEWTYGEYDKRYADALLPYIDRLKGAKPLVVCQQAQQHIGELQKKEADSLSLSDKDYLVPYVRRAAIIAFREGMMLYIMMGKWTREIADYVEWSLKYQLWCCDRFFGRRIRGAYEDEKAAERGNSAVQKNLLADVPDEFVAEDMKRLFVGLGKKAEAASAYLRQQVKRGNVVRTDNGFRKTERFRQRYEGMV